MLASDIILFVCITNTLSLIYYNKYISPFSALLHFHFQNNLLKCCLQHNVPWCGVTSLPTLSFVAPLGVYKNAFNKNNYNGILKWKYDNITCAFTLLNAASKQQQKRKNLMKLSKMSVYV